MKKYVLVSVCAASTAAASLFFGASSSFAAVPLGGVVQANIYGNSAANVSSGTVASSSVDVNANLTTGANAGMNATGSAYANSGANGNAGVINANINIASNDPQLNAYAQSIAESDASVSAVSTTNDNVSISYKVPVKLFGFIPVHETETVSVDTSGDTPAPQASVHQSWWSFLATGGNGPDASTLSSNLNARLSGLGSNPSQADVMAEIEATDQSSRGTE